MSPAASHPDTDAPLRRTPLYALHIHLGAKMVPFAGYEMPLQYPGGIRHEHEHIRAAAGLFDVSHMGRIRVRGADAAAALEGLVTGDIVNLPEYGQRYTLFTNDDGGVIDDLMVARTADGLMLVVNAACKDADLAYLERHLDGCEVELLSESALLALQGPAAATVIQRYNPEVNDLAFLQAGEFELEGIPCFVTRSGYTGEDGFEIAVPADRAEALAGQLLEQEEVEPAGLGARDSLRLEAGLCLYGHDLDETTTPVEADLAWTVAAKYRKGRAEARFPGAGRILAQLEQGCERRRVGLRAEGRVPVREGADLVDADHQPAGIVTSGGFGPSVGAPVAMGYVRSDCSEAGTRLQAQVRGRYHDLVVTGLPFVRTRYHKT
jgi:aminomethyltransferase